MLSYCLWVYADVERQVKCCPCGENMVMWYVFLWWCFNNMGWGGGVGWQQLSKWPPHHTTWTCVSNMLYQSLSWLTQTGHVNHPQLWQDNEKHCPHLLNRHRQRVLGGTHSVSISAGTPRFQFVCKQLRGDSSISLMTRHWAHYKHMSSYGNVDIHATFPRGCHV